MTREIAAQLKETELFASSDAVYSQLDDLLNRGLLPDDEDLFLAMTRLQKALLEIKR